ncbi:hypothetical protein HYALB_00001335 [Hymenoscyphus albidus]|uniref:Alcohol acetyltransferase n=1 Tax=Hymenoscyphus albidus TaxID=595503 RepID=A0A9N9PYK9_9HELO|nr:hypothetical protein HYALB_00001335 [Hymenoscyphus albidus]
MDSQIVSGGFLLKYYAARHSLGHYRSFGVTGIYHFPPCILASHSRFTEILKFALSKTITRHSTLSFGVVERLKNVDAHFYRQREINFEDVVEFRSSTAVEKEEDEVLGTEIGISHRHCWTEQTRKPGWKTVVVKHEENSNGRVDIIFVTHHALADGGSGGSFHKSLYLYLSEAIQLSSRSSNWPHQVPETTQPPPSIEDAFPFPPSATPPSSGPEENTPAPWGAQPPSLHSLDHALILAISPARLSGILTFCRTKNITLTSLLHFLTLTYLSTTLPATEAPSFKAITPYTMRRFTLTPPTEMVNHISFISTHFPISLTASLRDLLPSDEDSDNERELLKSVASQYQRQIYDELSFVTHQHFSPALLTQYKLVSTLSSDASMQEYHEKAIGKEREYAYEISNIGVLYLDAPGSQTPKPTGEEVVTLERLVFSQCAMPTGPAIGCSVASIANGPLSICFTWQEGIVEEDFVRGLRGYMERRLAGFTA